MKAQDQKVDESKFKKYVCIHWLNKQCKYGDNDCKFLHIYDKDKLPPCKFMQQTGSCPNENCPFKHDILTKMKNEMCPFYERGFCRPYTVKNMRNIEMDPLKRCEFMHSFQRICENYMIGFCPDGPKCSKIHIKSLIGDSESSLSMIANFPH